MNSRSEDFSKTLEKYLLKDKEILNSEAMNKILDKYEANKKFLDDVTESEKEEISKEIIKALSKESNFKAYRRTTIRDIIDCFEIYGGFLNNIKTEDREKSCRSLDIWISEYIYSKYLNELYEVLHPKKTEPSKEIKKDLKIIEHFEKMIKNKIDLYSLKTTNYSNDIENLFNTIDKLKDDLISKSFFIFSKYKYYQFELTPKKEFESILRIIIKDYDLKNTSLPAKQLKDSL